MDLGRVARAGGDEDAAVEPVILADGGGLQHRRFHLAIETVTKAPVQAGCHFDSSLFIGERTPRKTGSLRSTKTPLLWGGIVDERALAAALEAGRLGGIALDVLCEEPPAPDHALILTPHPAFYSRESVVKLQTKAAEEVASEVFYRLPRTKLPCSSSFRPVSFARSITVCAHVTRPASVPPRIARR